MKSQTITNEWMKRPSYTVLVMTIPNYLRPSLVVKIHHCENRQAFCEIIIIIFWPQYSIPREWKKYAIQYKKVQKSSWDEPYSSSSFTKQSCSKMALHRWIGTESRWNKKLISLSSPDWSASLRPSLERKTRPDAFIIITGGAFSTQQFFFCATPYVVRGLTRVHRRGAVEVRSTLIRRPSTPAGCRPDDDARGRHAGPAPTNEANIRLEANYDFRSTAAASARPRRSGKLTACMNERRRPAR